MTCDGAAAFRAAQEKAAGCVSDGLVIDLFAGPGGWDEGLRIAGYAGELLGVEVDPVTCKTAITAGHKRLQADVATLPTEPFIGRVAGLVASPPCTTFSNAGQGAGRRLTEVLITAITRTARGRKVMAATRRMCGQILRSAALKDSKMRKWTRAARSRWASEQATLSVLVVEPVRWIYTLRPRWIALEQVGAVAPLWRHMELMLHELGYKAWSGVLSAEQYGVPQTRKRAILVARNDGRPVGPPEPTHQPYRAGRQLITQPDLFGDPLPPPVSMADALGWHETTSVEFQRGKGMAERHGERPHRPAPAPAPTIRAGIGGVGTNLVVHMAPAGTASRMVEPRSAPDAPAHTITGKGTAAWVLEPASRTRKNDGTLPRSTDDPAMTVAFGKASMEWKLRNGNQRNACERRASEPAGTLFFGGKVNTVDWVRERPATTVCGDARIAAPGHRDRAGGEPQFTAESRRVTVQEAAVLQSFRPDYPWMGTMSQQFRQVGNAVPPLLAAAVLRQFVQRPDADGAAGEGTVA